MSVHDSRVARRLRRVSLVAALALAVLANGTALAQDPLPSANQGPRFGQWGPDRSPPAAEGPVAGATAPMESHRLGAPGPGPGAAAPAPAPHVWGGCNYGLSGTWAYHGEETSPAAFLYSGQAQVTQYGHWIQSTEIQQGSGAVTNYYGQCTGSSIHFDVYQGSQFIGYQNGSVTWSPRFGLRAQFHWVTWDPSTGQQASGTESWR